jgi:hypothetical protein
MKADTGIPAPPTFESTADPTLLLVIWSVFAVVAVAVAARLALRHRDPLPVVACAGAVICALNEPIFDVLANLTYARTPHVAFSAFGREIPWTIPTGYIPWVGLMPYVLYRMMAAGVTRRRLHEIAAGLIGSVLVLEVVNALWWHNWKYYGEAPARGVLGGGVVQMAAMPLMCALLYLIVAEHTRGWQRAALGLVLPGVSLALVFAATTWPLYVSNHADVPAALDWLAAAIAVALSLGAVPLITRVAGSINQAHPRVEVLVRGENVERLRAANVLDGVDAAERADDLSAVGGDDK